MYGVDRNSFFGLCWGIKKSKISNVWFAKTVECRYNVLEWSVLEVAVASKPRQSAVELDGKNEELLISGVLL